MAYFFFEPVKPLLILDRNILVDLVGDMSSIFKYIVFHFVSDYAKTAVQAQVLKKRAIPATGKETFQSSS